MIEKTFSMVVGEAINSFKDRGVSNVDILSALDEWRSHVERWTRNDVEKANRYLLERQKG